VLLRSWTAELPKEKGEKEEEEEEEKKIRTRISR
jgi:hypothetical protein